MAKETILIPLRSALDDNSTGLRDMFEIWDAIMPVIARYYGEPPYDILHHDIFFCDYLYKLPYFVFSVELEAVVPKQKEDRCKVWEWDKKKVLRGKCLEAVKFKTKPMCVFRLINELYDGYTLHHFYSGEFVLPAEMVVEHLQAKGYDLKVEVGWGGLWFETKSIRLVKETEKGLLDVYSHYICLKVDFGTDAWSSFLKDMKDIYLEIELEAPEPSSEVITEDNKDNLPF